MREYRIFLLNDGVVQSSVFFKCATDQEAVDKARQIANAVDFEIWEGIRIIVRGKSGM